jgi:hypothetical protein
LIKGQGALLGMAQVNIEKIVEHLRNKSDLSRSTNPQIPL